MQQTIFQFEFVINCHAQKKKGARQLTCRYRRHNPIFYISPLLEEELNLDPRIVMFHKAMSDGEIIKVKEMASPRVNLAFTICDLTDFYVWSYL